MAMRLWMVTIEHTPKTAASKKRRSFWWCMIEADTQEESLQGVQQRFKQECDPRTDCPIYGMATDITGPILRYVHGSQETPADKPEPAAPSEGSRPAHP